MKKTSKVKTIIAIVILLIIGIIIMIFNKFRFNVNYSKNVRLEFNLGKSYTISDILQITSEVYSDQSPIIRKSGDYNETVDIILNYITDEKNEELIQKINDKYETELKVDDINVYNNSNVRGRDLIKPFIGPLVISLIFILLFFVIRYIKLGIYRILGGVITVLVGTPILYLTLTSIFEMQINEATIGIGLMIVIFCLMYLIATYEKHLKKM